MRFTVKEFYESKIFPSKIYFTPTNYPIDFIKFFSDPYIIYKTKLGFTIINLN